MSAATLAAWTFQVADLGAGHPKPRLAAMIGRGVAAVALATAASCAASLAAGKAENSRPVHPAKVPGFATVRTNPFTGAPEALGVVGSGYHPLQNEEHCDFLNHLADASGAIFDTAGSLRAGRQVFVTMRLPESLMVGRVDRVDLFIAALNSHDGNSAFRLLLTPVRVVCANTQAAALRDHVSSVSTTGA